MRILMITPFQLSRELGSPKALLELSDEIRAQGHSCEVVGLAELGAVRDRHFESSYPEILRQYILRRAPEFDVIEYDHAHLPYPRGQFAQRPKLVARVQLLIHHLAEISIPVPKSAKYLLKKWLRAWPDHRLWARKKAIAQRTLEQADAVIVLNDRDRDRLIRAGIPDRKCHLIPNGMARKTHAALSQVDLEQPRPRRVGFIGTFDFRKGAADFGSLAHRLLGSDPKLGLVLLGTAGMFQGEKAVLKFFDRNYHARIQVIPSFRPEQLPELLGKVSVGIFPSYVEGFGLGVLEMMAAGVPVVAYDSPGPQMMLGPKFRVAPGDCEALCNKVLALLSDPESLRKLRAEVRLKAGEFQWEKAASRTLQVYEDLLR